MTASDNLLCPLAPSEQRLSDSLSLWLEAKYNYFNPNSFRLSLNNCIQTMRNVSFVLQKTKSQFTNFDGWYGGWQDKMRKDSIMTWLVEARNVIVKEGDLSTSSKLRLAVVETWFAPPYIEINAPLFIETEDFIESLAKNKPSNIDLKVGLLRAERRWIDEQLEDCELLEALSHVFVLLSDLLLDAHENLHYQEDLLKCPWYACQNPYRGRCIDCMKAQEWDRIIWLELNTGQTLRPIDFPVRKIDDKVVKEHYPDLSQRTAQRKKPKNLKEEADLVFEGAKTILTTDGFHVPIAMLGYPNGHRDLVALQMLDRTEKHLAIRKLAADMEKSGATSIILIGEVWVSSTENYRLTPRGVESPTLREALQLIAANAEGETYIREIFFTKDMNGKISLGKESSVSHGEVNILKPIKEVWNKKTFH